MKTILELQKEFGARICTLNTGAAGLRGGMRCTVKQIGDAPVMDFIGSDGSIDRYNEVIDQAGWQLDNFRANPVIPDCHDYSSIAKILGRAQTVTVTNGQLCNRVEFCVDNPLGNLAWKMAQGGFIKSQSVGFIPIEWTNGNATGQPDRTYTTCELLEISLVVVPANPGATIGNLTKAFDAGALQKSDLRELHSWLKQFCSDEKPNSTGKGSASAGARYDAQSLVRNFRGLEEAIKRM